MPNLSGNQQALVISSTPEAWLEQVEAQLHMFEEESSASACGQLAEEVYGPMSGQVTSVARQAFRL